MARNKRKTKFIEPKVQGALIRRLLIHYLVFLATACVFSLFLQVLSDPFAPIHEHLTQVWRTQGPFIVTLIGLLPVFLRDTVTMSHRFVGPIVRMRKLIQQAARGVQTPPMKLRPADFWKEFAEDLNGLFARIETQADNQQNELLVNSR